MWMIMRMLAVMVWLILRVEIPLHRTRRSNNYETPVPLHALTI
jgi:hypothetical protein